MQTSFEKITRYDGGPELFRDFLRKYGFDKIFGPLYELYASADLARRIINYIVHSYSMESDYIIEGVSWIGVKENVAKEMGIPDEQYDIIVHLGNHASYEVKRKPVPNPKDRDDFEKKENVLENKADDELEEDEDDQDLRVNKYLNVVIAWMDFQNDRDFKHLQMLKDQYEECMIASRQKLTKQGGGVDWATKSVCRKQAGEILVEIEQYEKKIRDRDPMMIREAKREIKSIRPETTIPV